MGKSRPKVQMKRGGHDAAHRRMGQYLDVDSCEMLYELRLVGRDGDDVVKRRCSPSADSRPQLGPSPPGVRGEDLLRGPPTRTSALRPSRLRRNVENVPRKTTPARCESATRQSSWTPVEAVWRTHRVMMDASGMADAPRLGRRIASSRRLATRRTPHVIADATHLGERLATRRTPRIVENAPRPGERNVTWRTRRVLTDASRPGQRLASWHTHNVMADAKRLGGRLASW